MAERSGPKYLEADAANACAARIRCLDHFMGQHQSDVTNADYSFIASMKDWVDKTNRPITFRQEWRVNQIWNNVTDHTDLEADDYTDGFKYKGRQNPTAPEAA